MKRAVILGGGIAGLVAAFRRAERKGAGETLLFEGAGRLGGAVRTFREDGFTLEAGPSTLRTNPAAEKLIADLGLEADVVVANPRAPRWIVRKGRARAITPGPGGIFTSALTPAGKLRILAEPRVPPRPAELDDESVESFVRRRFGPEAARYAAGPIVSGVYAGDPASLSIRSAFPRLWEAEGRSGSVVRDFWRHRKEPRPPRPRTLNFRRGLEGVVDALASRVTGSGATIFADARVSAVEGPFASEAAPKRWRVRTTDGRSIDSDSILSTLDAPALARLLGERLPRSRARLAAIASSPVAVVPLVFEPGGGAPLGFGVLVPRGEGYRSLGILYPSSLFTGRTPEGLVATSSFLGGALDPDLVDASDEELFSIAEEEVRRLHPRLGRRAGRWLARWPSAIPRLPLGHHETLRLLEEDLAELDGGAETLLVTGAWRDGVSLGDRIEKGARLGTVL
ncbi:MAG TPA: protoporphyrinogen oxidase [Thermoanaerobaculia bacterium]|nr:protoporphyrinogen oxidase [Thermoanaerobaculia bacterium]